MESKHTPGPWEYNPDYHQVMAPNASWFIIASLPKRRGSAPIDKANAQLIAAAPALLEALEMVMEVAFDGPSQPVSSSDNIAWKRDIERRARSAIRQAKGEA